MPDDPIIPDPAEVVDPPAPAAVDPAPAAIDPPASDPQPDPAPAADPAPSPQPTAATMPRWGWDRLSEETNKRQAAEDRERAAVERANTMEEIARRLQAAPKDPADPPQPAPRAAAPAPASTPDAVQQEAARIVFNRDVQTISDTGFKTYGQRWTDAVGVLNACGANTLDFVASVIDIEPDKAHEIMFQIAQDGERAVSLARMTPTRRAAEITRMIMANAPAAADPKPADPKPAADPAPAAKPALSRAPAPKPAIAPHAAAADVDPTTPEGNDKLDDKQFEAWYKGKYMKRSA